MVCRLTRMVDHGVQASVVEETETCTSPPAAEQGSGTPSAGAGAGAGAASTYSSSSSSSSSGQRKRKERHESCGSAQERKVVRSNSEERPLESGVARCKDNIRRVNSHEDFSLTKTGRKLHPRTKHHTSSGSSWAGDTSGCTFIIGEDDSSSSTKSSNTSSRSSNTTTTTLTATGNSSHHTSSSSSSSSNAPSQPANPIPTNNTVSSVHNTASAANTTTSATNSQITSCGNEMNVSGTFVANNNSINHSSSNSTSKSFLSEVIDSNMGHGVRAGLPLQERNESHLLSDNLHTQGRETSVDEELDDTEHERRRSCERFARSAAPSRGRRNIGRRRRPALMKSSVSHSGSSVPAVSSSASVGGAAAAAADDTDGGSSSKENEEQDNSLARSHQLHASVPSDDEGASSCSSSSHSFLQLHPQEHERSPSPEPSPGVAPPLDLSTLHQHVGSTEPVTSRATWSHQGGEHEEMIASSRVMLSPRNSLILNRRVYLDIAVSPPPPLEHDSVTSQAQTKLKQLNKQANSLKKKIKKIEEEFEKEHGYRPSHSEKVANKDTKRLFTELNKLRKGIKQIKEDPNNVDSAFIQGTEEESISSRIQSVVTMDEVIQEVELHLCERRRQAGRPESLEEMNRDQLLEEKVSVQKALLHMEDHFGRPVTKGDRDLVRPLYDRYRMLKRMVIRTAPSKMKDSISELATIHEHETMDFTSSPPSLTTSDEKKDAGITSAAAAAAAAVVATAPPPLLCLSEPSEVVSKNLHSLSLSELLSQQQSTREEKKRLRRSLREFEEDFQRRTGKKLQREDRLPMEEIYSSYKQAKAKLRLLDALVSKASM